MLDETREGVLLLGGEERGDEMREGTKKEGTGDARSIRFDDDDDGGDNDDGGA